MKDVFYPNPRVEVTGTVVVGQKVYCGLYGGKYGIIYAIHGEQKPATIGNLMGFISTGGNARFDIVFENGYSKQLPESILHGVQWKIFSDVASAEDIVEAKAIADESIAAAEAKQKAEAKVREELAAKIKAENPHLIQVSGSNMSPGKCAAKNIRVELKAAFPKVKFSVKSNYDSVSVTWDNGPSVKKVQAICSKYQAGNFNGMEDIYEYNDDAVWATVFGDPKYVSCSRTVTEDNMAAIVNGWEPGKAPEDMLPPNLAHGGRWRYSDIAREIVRDKDIPVGQKVVGLKRTDEVCGNHGELYDLVCASLAPR